MSRRSLPIPQFHKALLIYAALAAILLCSSSACDAQVAAHGFLHREHMRMVNGDGQPVVLRAIKCWDTPQPYDILLPDPDGDYFGGDYEKNDLRDDLEAVVTPEEADRFLMEWRLHFMEPKDIAWLHSQGFNTISTYINYKLFYDPKTGRDIDDGFTYLDHLVNGCAASNMYLVVSMEFVPGGRIQSLKGNIFTDEKKQAIFAHVWQRIAARYADSPTIAGWDLIGEPFNWTGKLVPLYKLATQAIRQVDPNHMIIIEGDSWSHNLVGLSLTDPSQVWDQNMALSFHIYDVPIHDTPDSNGKYREDSLTEDRIVAAKLDLPLYNGEFGVNSNAWIGRMKQACEHPDVLYVDGKAIDAPIGWCYLQYKRDGLTGLLTFHAPDSYKIVTDYLNARLKDPNTPKPSDAAAFAALMDFAHCVDFDKCTVCKDTVDCLTRPDFTTKPVPYARQTIPGRITAAYYDMGDEDVAYHNTPWDDEINDGNVWGHMWNPGWGLRNDGVGIAETPGEGPTVGWIDQGEWLDYTVNCTPGTYKLSVRYSCVTPSSHFHITLDGYDITGPVDLPVTGDWGQYKTITIKDVTVHQTGQRTLRFMFDTGGYNLSWVDFQRLSPADSH